MKKALSCEGAFLVSMRSQSLDCSGGGLELARYRLPRGGFSRVTRCRS